MRTKQVVDRQKEAQAVIAAGRTHGTELVTLLSERQGPLLKRGEKLPDYGLQIELMMRQLEQSTAHLVQTDDAYQRELLDDEGPRRERDEATEGLAVYLIELREVLTGLYGAQVLLPAGFSQQTPRDSVLLSRFAGQVQSALGAVTLPAPRVKGAQVDIKATVAELDKRRARLDSALAAVARETREAQAAMSLRNDAQDQFDDVYTQVSTVLSGLLRLAGKPDLADRVRPTIARRADKPEAPGPTPAGPAGPTN
jgi:hypothetical protein